jgi:hypothetical protein
LVKDINGKIVNNTVLLQYHIKSAAEEVTLEVCPHGNSKAKRNVPFYPTACSTLNAIKEELKEKPLAQTYQAVSDRVGGITGAKTVGELPQSRKQVYDLQSNSKIGKDPVDELLLYAQYKEEKVVLHHKDMPLDLLILGTETMCQNVGQFSCSDKLSHPISIDPTFNMDHYEVTPIVYKHLFLTTKRYGENPIFLGPTMLHHKKRLTHIKCCCQLSLATARFYQRRRVTLPMEKNWAVLGKWNYPKQHT